MLFKRLIVRPIFFIFVFGIFFWLSLAKGRSASVTVDFPLTGNWRPVSELAGAPTQQPSSDGEGTTDFVMLPVTDEAKVFVTVVFQENGSNDLSLLWKNEETGAQSILSALLTDGVTGLNQRTVAIPANLASQGGHLVISGEQDKILRVRLDWIEPSPVYVAEAQEAPVLVAHGKALGETDLSGGELLTPPDVWLGNVLKAPLQEQPAALSGSTEFIVPMEETGEQELLRARFLGVKMGGSVNVWINGRAAGTIQPATPALSDPGYLRVDGKAVYAGWREGALLVGDGLMKAGDNSIIIETSDTNVFIRDTALEIRTAPQPVATPGESDIPDESVAGDSP